MSKVIYVEASPRKSRSHSSKLASIFIESYKNHHPEDIIQTIDLWSTDLPAFNDEKLNAKYSIMHGEDPSDSEKSAWKEIESIFTTFNEADKYIFSVPMWNFGLPYVLKHYIDVITQPGLAWSFSPESGYSGLVQGKVLAIYATGGAYDMGSETEAFDLQKPAFEGWLSFIGLTDVERLVVAPTLAAPDEVTAMEESLALDAKKMAESF